MSESECKRITRREFLVAAGAAIAGAAVTKAGHLSQVIEKVAEAAEGLRPKPPEFPNVDLKQYAVTIASSLLNDTFRPNPSTSYEPSWVEHPNQVPGIISLRLMDNNPKVKAPEDFIDVNTLLNSQRSLDQSDVKRCISDRYSISIASLREKSHLIDGVWFFRVEKEETRPKSPFDYNIAWKITSDKRMVHIASNLYHVQLSAQNVIIPLVRGLCGLFSGVETLPLKMSSPKTTS